MRDWESKFNLKSVQDKGGAKNLHQFLERLGRVYNGIRDLNMRDFVVGGELKMPTLQQAQGFSNKANENLKLIRLFCFYEQNNAIFEAMSDEHIAVYECDLKHITYSIKLFSEVERSRKDLYTYFKIYRMRKIDPDSFLADGPLIYLS